MDKKLMNKIEANDTSIRNLLANKKFTIDYFQCEYRWEEKHTYGSVKFNGYTSMMIRQT